MITADQTQRIWEICREWNRMRDGTREEATPAEVLEFLITQEEIGIAAQTRAEELEAFEAQSAIATGVGQ
jgi:hypothetical protein